MLKVEASDLHLKVGHAPTLRLRGLLRSTDHPALSTDDTEKANNLMMPARCRETFESEGSTDYSYLMSAEERFRVNAFHQNGMISLAIRPVACKIPTFKDLNLPAVVQRMAEFHSGLVLVTGVTGAGKSSSLAAMIDWINTTRRNHIITIEDPIEFLHRDKKSIVEQIEVGADVIDFKAAVRNCVRQDPDVILIGELRDHETVKAAMQCVETGHLVLSTLHTPDVKQTVLRLLHFFPMEDHDLIREDMAMNLKAVLSQRLVRAAGGKGRVPCCEILFESPIVEKLIREGRYDDIDTILKNGEEGMQSFDHHLVQLVKSKVVGVEEAMKVVRDAASFKRALAGRQAGGEGRHTLQE